MGSSYYPLTLRSYRCPADCTETGDDSFGPGSYATNQLVFRQRSRLGSFADGVAHTVLIAEKYGACSFWALAEGRQTPRYVPTPTSGFQVWPEQCDPELPQTPHRAGIQVGMADGGVRRVVRDVPPELWFAVHTPAGGEALGHGPYADWNRCPPFDAPSH